MARRKQVEGPIQMKEGAPRNQINARGKIIGIGRNEYGHRAITLFIRGSRDREPVYLKFTLDDQPMDMSIRPGDFVNVKGELRAFSYKDEIRNKYNYVQFCVAKEVTPDVTQMEKVYGIPGFAHQDSYNEVLLAGTIKRVTNFQGSNWTILSIQVPGTGRDKRPSQINVQYSSRMAIADLDFEVGDEVAVWGFVFTKTKESKSGESVTYEDVIANDIVYIKKKERQEEQKDEPVKEEAQAPMKQDEDDPDKGLDEVEELSEAPAGDGAAKQPAKPAGRKFGLFG